MNERLEKFENMRREIITSRESITRQLEELRAQGKTKSWQFKELMGRKLSLAYAYDMLIKYGVDKEP